MLRVVYLIFTEGYAASAARSWSRPDLADEAIRLARILHRLLPAEREVAGLLALLLLVDARRAARPDRDGELVLLDDQDRSLWDRDQIEEGRGAGASTALHRRAARAVRAAGGDRRRARRGGRRRRPPTGRRSSRSTTCWREVAPSPLVELNRAVAVAMRDGPAAGLALLDELAGDQRLRGYHLLPAARADLLRRLGRAARRPPPTGDALELAGNEPERAFLRRRIMEVDGGR